MHIETVHFDRVFDVQSGTFSFDSAGKRQFSVCFDRQTVPHEGARYAVVLDEPGNWQTVLGWRDLGTSRVGLARSAWEVATSTLLDLSLYGLIFPAAALVFGGVWAALAVLGAIVVGFVVLVRGAVLHNRKMERLLQAVPSR